MMIAIVSLVSESHTWSGEGTQTRADLACGPDEFQAVHQPHLTWMAVEDLEREASLAALERLSIDFGPIRASVWGYGVFPGEFPTVTLGVLKTEAIRKMHQQLWTELSPRAKGINAYYAPAVWMPHITMVYHDGTLRQAPCALDALIPTSPQRYAFEINNLAMIYQTENEEGIHRKIPL